MSGLEPAMAISELTSHEVAFPSLAHTDAEIDTIIETAHAAAAEVS